MKTSETTPWDEFDIHLASSLKAQYTEHSDEEIEDRLSTIMSTNVSSLDERRRRPARMLPAVLVGAAAASLIAFTLLRTEPTTRVDTYPNLGPASIPDGGPKPAPTVKPAPTSAPTSVPSASNTTLGEAVPGPSGSVPTPSVVPDNEADDAAIEASFQAPDGWTTPLHPTSTDSQIVLGATYGSVNGASGKGLVFETDPNALAAQNTTGDTVLRQFVVGETNINELRRGDLTVYQWPIGTDTTVQGEIRLVGISSLADPESMLATLLAPGVLTSLPSAIDDVGPLLGSFVQTEGQTSWAESGYNAQFTPRNTETRDSSVLRSLAEVAQDGAPTVSIPTLPELSEPLRYESTGSEGYIHCLEWNANGARDRLCMSSPDEAPSAAQVDAAAISLSQSGAPRCESIDLASAPDGEYTVLVAGGQQDRLLLDPYCEEGIDDAPVNRLAALSVVRVASDPALDIAQPTVDCPDHRREQQADELLGANGFWCSFNAVGDFVSHLDAEPQNPPFLMRAATVTMSDGVITSVRTATFS